MRRTGRRRPPRRSRDRLRPPPGPAIRRRPRAESAPRHCAPRRRAAAPAAARCRARPIRISSSNSRSTSRPFCWRVRPRPPPRSVPRAPPPPPKNVWKKSEKGLSPPPNISDISSSVIVRKPPPPVFQVAPGLAPPPNGPPGPADWYCLQLAPSSSYFRRLSGSLRTSFASLISLKRASAEASPGFTSGRDFRASLRNACLISFSVAVFATPRVE